MQIVLYVLLGLIGGGVGGALGLGGGSILVPGLVFLFGLSQHEAQGTSLAVMLPPIFILAVMRYYHAGHVNVKMAAIIAIGFVVGALIGAHCAQYIPDTHLKKIFGTFLILMGIKMLI
ncbi:MAG: sulfite exporter TauE/SafE family protein [Candidatus Zapsychrus exili]|nr:sulfite exporter TauE/SafE family protein [Candidatus Zapsychrus exili]